MIEGLKSSMRAISAYRQRLIGIDKVLKNRDQTSWRSMQHDEEWMFIHMQDEIVCLVCRGHGFKIFRGDYIPYKFMYFSFLDSLTIEPNVHTRCRCILEWLNAADAIRGRLEEELYMYDVIVTDP